MTPRKRYGTTRRQTTNHLRMEYAEAKLCSAVRAFDCIVAWTRAHWRAVLIAAAFLVVGRWDYDDELQRAREHAARAQTQQLERADLAARVSREIPQ